MDEKDVVICRMLAVNSRTSYREIGDGLGLSVNSVHKRVQALIADGVINRFVLVPSLKMLDTIVVMLYGYSSTHDMKGTLKALGANPNTYRIVQATGNYLYVHGVLKRASEMERYISFVRKTGQMDQAETGIVSSPETLALPLSRLDYQIMMALEADSRRDLSDVSEEIGVSTRTIKRRLDRMVAAKAVHPSIEFNPAASSAVVCMLHLTIAKKVERQDAIAYIVNSHQDIMLGLAGLDNHPELLFFTVWSPNMKELRTLQDSVEASGLFSTAVPHVFYSIQFFDSWMDKLIADRAEAKE